MKYKAVIFDMDGTLGDTLPLCVEAFRRCVYELTGRRPEAAEVTQYFGVSDRGVLGNLLGMNPDAPELPIDRLVETYVRLQPEWTPAPFPGARDLLCRLRGRGIRTALITGKEDYTGEPTIRHFGMQGLFDLVCYGKPTHNCKDERLREVMQAWQLSPEELLYVGDAPSDIALCHKEGVAIINAAWAPSAAEEEEACLALLPEYRLTDFNELEPLINTLTT